MELGCSAGYVAGKFLCASYQDDMGLDGTKPVFGVYDKAILKPVSSTSET